MNDRTVNSMEIFKILFGIQQVQILCETIASFRLSAQIRFLCKSDWNPIIFK